MGDPGTAAFERVQFANAPRRMATDKSIPPDSVRVMPGEYFATSRNVAIVTVLGSCVAACVRDTRQRIGGMNHFMLPRARAGAEPSSSPARYGVHAMELLINHLLRLGARRENLEAKVFGGGSVIEGLTAVAVGRDNAEFVTEFLREESIPVVASDMEGARSRKVCYFPATGRVLVRALGNADRRAVALREARYGRNVDQTPCSGAVELFR